MTDQEFIRLWNELSIDEFANKAGLTRGAVLSKAYRMRKLYGIERVPMKRPDREHYARMGRKGGLAKVPKGFAMRSKTNA